MVITMGNDSQEKGGKEKVVVSKKEWYLEHLTDILLTLVISVSSTLVTFQFQHGAGVPSVVASAVVGVLAHGVLLTPYREIAFAGTFGGMGSHYDNGGIFTVPYMTLIGFLTGFLLLCFKRFLNGVGGKLGTTSYVSGVITECIMVLVGSREMRLLEDKPYGMITPVLACISVAASTTGATATISLLKCNINVTSSTLASCITGLTAIVVMSLFQDIFDDYKYMNFVASFAYAGSFVGMTAASRLRPAYITIAGGLAGCILLSCWPVFPGVGGKYGTASFIAVLVVMVAQPKRGTNSLIGSAGEHSQACDRGVETDLSHEV